MEITVSELCQLFTERFQSIELWDIEQEKVVFSGTIDDISGSGYADSVVQSIDSLSAATQTITVNI